MVCGWLGQATQLRRAGARGPPAKSHCRGSRTIRRPTAPSRPPGQPWVTMPKPRKAAEKAFRLSAGRPREERLSIEGLYRDSSGDWVRAVEIYRTLFGFFSDDLEYGLRLANAQTAAGQEKWRWRRSPSCASFRLLPAAIQESTCRKRGRRNRSPITNWPTPPLGRPQSRGRREGRPRLPPAPASGRSNHAASPRRSQSRHRRLPIGQVTV